MTASPTSPSIALDLPAWSAKLGEQGVKRLCLLKSWFPCSCINGPDRSRPFLGASITALSFRALRNLIDGCDSHGNQFDVCHQKLVSARLEQSTIRCQVFQGKEGVGYLRSPDLDKGSVEPFDISYGNCLHHLEKDVEVRAQMLRS